MSNLENVIEPVVEEVPTSELSENIEKTTEAEVNKATMTLPEAEVETDEKSNEKPENNENNGTQAHNESNEKNKETSSDKNTSELSDKKNSAESKDITLDDERTATEEDEKNAVKDTPLSDAESEKKADLEQFEQELLAKEQELAEKEKQLNTLFKVSFVDGITNEVFSIIELSQGGSVDVLPIAPTHEGYTFVDFTGNYQNVACDETVTANYETSVSRVVIDRTTTIAGYASDAEGVLAGEKIVLTTPTKTTVKNTRNDGFYEFMIDEPNEFEGAIIYYRGDEEVSRMIICSAAYAQAPATKINELVGSMTSAVEETTATSLDESTESVVDKIENMIVGEESTEISTETPSITDAIVETITETESQDINVILEN